MKNLWNRASLKSFFRKGQFPSEAHFGYLIDSTVNKLDDGITKTERDGLQLSPASTAENVISIFKEPTDQYASWQISLKNDEHGGGLSFNSVQADDAGKAVKTSRLFLANNGRIGVGSSQPRMQLEVGGALGIHTRVGSFAVGQAPGDGEWHDVISGLSGIHAFEVVARIDGPAKRGKYALTHAIALSACGGSSNRVQQVRAHYGWFRNRIEFRWHGPTDKYSLQVRTRSHYGLTPKKNLCMIRFHLTQLWDDSIFPPKEEEEKASR